MKIHVKCFATLSKADHCDYKDSQTSDLEENSDVKDLITKLGLPEDDVKIIFVNGKRVEAGEKLFDGDRVGFFPPVGGM